MASGVALLAIELLLIDAQFYLVFLGLAALVVGLVDWTGVGLSPAAQWGMFAVAGLVFLAAFRRRMYERLRARLPTMASGPEGELVTLPEDLAPGASCRIEHRGSQWTALNGGAVTLVRGSRARIVRVEGLTLVVGGGD
jgi:membrane protein implicated in regulation of membrane protease activity